MEIKEEKSLLTSLKKDKINQFYENLKNINTEIKKSKYSSSHLKSFSNSAYNLSLDKVLFKYLFFNFYFLKRIKVAI